MLLWKIFKANTKEVLEVANYEQTVHWHVPLLPVDLGSALPLHLIQLTGQVGNSSKTPSGTLHHDVCQSQAPGFSSHSAAHRSPSWSFLFYDSGRHSPLVMGETSSTLFQSWSRQIVRPSSTPADS